MSASHNEQEQLMRQGDQPYLGDNLIFILSQPRSGSTLLQRVLSGHPDIHTSAETWLMLHPIYGMKTKGIETEYGATFRAEAVTEFLENYADSDSLLDDASRAWAQVIYNGALQSTECNFFLDKTPRYFFVISDLYRLFPKAKFVFLIRNPMAVLASEIKTYIKEDWPLLSVFDADLVDAPGYLLEGMAELGDNAFTVRYEEFVTDPEGVIGNLCRFMGMEFFPEQMIDYAGTPAPKGKMNDPVGIHKHSRPSASSIDAWKVLAEDPQHRHFAQSYLATLGRQTIEQLGYSYDDIHAVLHPSPAGAGAADADLFPWDIAIKPEAKWTFREQLVAQRYFATKTKGSFRGNLSAVKQTLKRSLAELRVQLSRG